MRGFVQAAAFAVMLGACAQNDAGSQAKATSEVWVSLVPKGSVSAFLNRWATPAGQIVVTTDAPEAALESVRIERRDGHRYVLVETFAPLAERLPGEVAKVAGIRVVAIPAWVEGDAHAFLGRHDLHAEEIGTEVHVVPAGAKPEALPRGLAEFVVPEIAPDYLEAKLRQFSGKDPFVIDGNEYRITERGSAEGRRLARLWLKHEFEALGYTVSEHSYSSSGTNLIAERAGADTSRYLIVSAHYDSVRNAGADDDGAGVITALATARALAEAPLAVNLRFLAFDQEELGLVGSAAYARDLSRSGELWRLIGVVNVEMTGYDGDDDGAFHVIDCNENTSAQLTARVMEVVTRDPLRLRKVEACTNRSDHASFWRYDKPAVVLSQNFFGGDSNPCYHRSCDTVDRLNWDYMSRLSTAVARATASLVTE